MIVLSSSVRRKRRAPPLLGDRLFITDTRQTLCLSNAELRALHHRLRSQAGANQGIKRRRRHGAADSAARTLVFSATPREEFNARSPAIGGSGGPELRRRQRRSAASWRNSPRGHDGMDLYDVSCGGKLPMLVASARLAPAGTCTTTGGMADFDRRCLVALRLRVRVAETGVVERDAAFGEPNYCCSGAYPNTPILVACGVLEVVQERLPARVQLRPTDD
nr:thaumatin-like protein 1B [Ipomoea batatas]